MDFRDLSKDQTIVHTTLRRIEEISWKLPEIAVTLLSLRQAAPQQSKASFDCIRLALSLHRQQEKRQ